MKKLIAFLLCMAWACPAWAAASRSFDDVDDWISMGNVLDVTTGNVSVCAWVKTTDDASSDQFIGKKSSNASTAGYALQQQTTSDLHRFFVSDATEDIISVATFDADGTWYFNTGTYNASTETVIFYINATQEDTDTTANMDSLSNTGGFRMGASSNNSNDMLGLLGMGMQYSIVLTPVEISQVMWLPESVPASRGGMWPLWGDATEIDLSGNGNTGTPNGTTTSADGPPVMFGGGLSL